MSSVWQEKAKELGNKIADNYAENGNIDANLVEKIVLLKVARDRCIEQEKLNA